MFNRRQSLTLSSPVTSLPFIASAYATRLNRLGIHTVNDLLHHFPSRYLDRSTISTINNLTAEVPATVIATITKMQNIHTRSGKNLQKATITDQTGSIDVIWFNQIFLLRTLKVGAIVAIFGTPKSDGFSIVFSSPDYELLKNLPESGDLASHLHFGRLVPIYPETAGVSSKWLRSRINYALTHTILSDYLPPGIIQAYSLAPLNLALKQIHFPDTDTLLQGAKNRLAFDELFLLQLQGAMKRHQWHQQTTKFHIDSPKTKISDFINRLPFTLTKAQVQSATEILTDLGQPKPMNRLLEGDVGSGKTVVAALAMYATHLSGFNSVLMAPTEILAEQHFSTLKSLFAHTKITVGLHTGSTKISKPQDITVGTQALLFKPDLLLEVGLVVIDEQHRFGVGQRAKLQSLPNSPHRLTMSATPIPRTVALTLYGDLDVSLLDEMPKNRLAIKTYLVGPEKRAAAYQWIDKQISTGAQVYVVCPLIDTSSSVLLSEVKAAETEFETLKAIFPNRRLSLLHGKIKPKSKNQLLADYKSGHIDILVTTPVIEVGIDVPNASIMMIESAERFGLAQLHQLRGRVGRGVKQSYCLLFTSTATKTENHRLHALTKHTSGFKLSEIDLKHRGPGEVFGLAQHGFLDLKLASFTDHNLLSITKNASETLIDQDPELKTQPFLKSLITATPETTAN